MTATFTDEDIVKITTSEGNIKEVKVGIIKESVLIRGLIDDAGIEEEIPLPNVKRLTLDKIVEYCDYVTSNKPPQLEKPLRAVNISELVSPYFAQYIDV